MKPQNDNWTTEEKINFEFDDLIYQISQGNTHDGIKSGRRFESFEQVKKWKLKYGFKFNIYSNDHLIDGHAHFHFDNSNMQIATKIDFNGKLLESKGAKTIPKNVMKELKYFLSLPENKRLLIDMWNEKNPTLIIPSS